MPAIEGGPATVRPALVHEIKHDGYRLMVRRDGSRVTRNGHDWADRYPAIADAAQPSLLFSCLRAAAVGILLSRRP
jgi:ATP-dependent DNA ligase